MEFANWGIFGKKRFWLFVILVPFLFVFGGSLQLFLVLLLMVLSGVFVSMYRYVIPFNLGLELVTFYTIIVAIAVNPLVAIILAAIIILISHIVTQKFCFFMVIKMGVYAVVAVIAWALGGAELVALGIGITLVKNVVFEVITFMMNPGRAGVDLPSAVLNVLFNGWLFAQFGALVLLLL